MNVRTYKSESSEIKMRIEKKIQVMGKFNKCPSQRTNSQNTRVSGALIIQQQHIDRSGNEILVNENLMSGLETLLRSVYLLHWCAPEIVENDVLERRMWSQIAILLDGRNIIEDKVTIECIVIAKDAYKNYCRTIHV